ncbi:MAG: GNAT family N-acetyltransferase [Acidimicrobiales bacterium]|jgi:GNAT superfamily N-acetyltransferase
MSETGEVVYGVIGPEHAGEVHTLQRAAFVAEARLYGTVEIPPLVETVDEIRRELASTVTMGAWLGSRLVGTARLTLDGSIGWVSRVAVAPDLQGQGVGSRLLSTLESAAPPQVRRFQLGAGHKSGDDLAMNERRGYREVSRRVDQAGVELVAMGKDRDLKGLPPPTSPGYAAR